MAFNDVLASCLLETAEDKLKYYQQWMFNSPVIVSNKKFIESQQLHRIFYKLITCFVNNYDEYEALMPQCDKVKSILALWNNKDYSPGTYRTDFVLDDLGRFRPIEITCRFALNGFFQSAIIELHALKSLADKNLQLYQFPYARFLSYFIQKMGKSRRVIVLIGQDNKNESNLFIPILKHAGVSVETKTVDALRSEAVDFCDALIVNELSFSELLSLPVSVHINLCEANMMNDLRTVFLIHDKRFFSVINDQKLQEQALNKAEIKLCKLLFIPTYSYSEHCPHWQDAKNNKENWIIKHRALGKSQSIFAGVVTNDTVWESLFSREDIQEFVLQKWVPQKQFYGKVNKKEFNDYITGTFLFCDQFYFGFAEFRTSSFPITNKVDHRKCASLIVKNDNMYNYKSLPHGDNIGII